MCPQDSVQISGTARRVSLCPRFFLVAAITLILVGIDSAGAQSLSISHRKALSEECRNLMARGAFDTVPKCRREVIAAVTREHPLFQISCLDQISHIKARDHCDFAIYEGLGPYDKCLHRWASERLMQGWQSHPRTEGMLVFRRDDAKRISLSKTVGLPFAGAERSEWAPRTGNLWRAGAILSTSRIPGKCSLPGAPALSAVLTKFPGLRRRAIDWRNSGSLQKVPLGMINFVSFRADQYECVAFRRIWGTQLSGREPTPGQGTRHLTGYYCDRNPKPFSEDSVKTMASWFGIGDESCVKDSTQCTRPGEWGFTEFAKELLSRLEGIDPTSEFKIAIHEFRPEDISISLDAADIFNDKLIGSLLRVISSNPSYRQVRIVDWKYLAEIFDHCAKQLKTSCNLSELYRGADIQALIFGSFTRVDRGLFIRYRMTDSDRSNVLAQTEPRVLPFDFESDQRIHPPRPPRAPYAELPWSPITGEVKK